MSIDAMGWVQVDSRSKGGDRLVLLAIAWYADKHEPWIAWPSVATIGERAGLGERAARYALRRLEADGRVRVLSEPADQYGTRQYQIVTDAPADLVPDDEAPEIEAEPVEEPEPEPEPEPAPEPEAISGDVQPHPTFHDDYPDF